MIRKLWIKDFRNLIETVVNFDKNIFIYGDNNNGKTNFLESLFVLGNGKSPVDSPLEHLVSFDKKEAILGIDFDNEDSDRYYLKISSLGKKQGLLNNKSLRSLKSIQDKLNIEYISADVIRIFQDNADFRRKDLDHFCMKYEDSYASLLRDYDKTLKQKNKSLKIESAKDMIPIWNTQLVSLAGDLVSIRLKAILDIEVFISHYIHTLFPELGSSIRLKYIYKRLDIDSIDVYKQSLNLKLEQDAEKEKRMGYTLVGPQRDDFCIYIDDKELYSFFSRGINRSIAIIVKIAQIMVLDSKFKGSPILLMDEIFAELDVHKKEKLSPFIEAKCKIVYASICKQDSVFFDNIDCYNMKEGALINDV